MLLSLQLVVLQCMIQHDSAEGATASTDALHHARRLLLLPKRHPSNHRGLCGPIKQGML